jgi:pimeloyl-ACP methyl ester carboxylesterase
MARFWIVFTFLLIGLILVGIAVILVRYFKQIHAARKRLDSLGSQVIQTDCGQVEYLSSGKGYPLLVVHGAMGGFDQGLWLAKSFDFSNYQVIPISRFGYLRTPIPEGADLDLQAEAFAGLLDALNIRRAAVFAVSSGSTSAIRFAARHPERVSALILLSPDAPGEAQANMPPRFIFDSLLRIDFIYWALITFFWKQVQISIGLVPMGYVLTPEYKALLKVIQTGDLPVSRRMDGLIFETYTCDTDFKASVTPASPYPLQKIETPVLVINAADDPIAIPENVRRIAEQMPNARLFAVPDGGHFLFGHTQEVKSEIARFLNDSLAGETEM